jgi:hypothetical protein
MNCDIITTRNMHQLHSSHEACPLPREKASRYMERIKRGSRRTHSKRTMKMPISRSVYVSPALAGERRTVRHSIGALRQLEVETSKAIGANRGGRH